MNPIQVLDTQTINKIAAGEVVERPASVIKELVENAIDAQATNITVEIRDGGISLIRVTDNGFGMDEDALRMCFKRHATSKIRCEEDLNRIRSLGFRGEALSSISAVSRLEVMSKTPDALVGNRLYMEGGTDPQMQEAGLPAGTTFVVRNLFFNTPARRKFLKQPTAEMNAVTDLMEHLALSRPDISFQYIAQRQVRFQTYGNGDLKDVIYAVYGREIANALLPVTAEKEGVRIQGYVGRPELVRGSRSFETFFINHRYIKSDKLSYAVEEGCREYLMQHKFPFCVMQLEVEPTLVDVNVHPTKMEVRFEEDSNIPAFLENAVRQTMMQKEMIPDASLAPEKKPEIMSVVSPRPEPFEENRNRQFSTPLWQKFEKNMAYAAEEAVYEAPSSEVSSEPEEQPVSSKDAQDAPKQLDLFEEKLLTKEKSMQYRFIGQVFDTYWLIQYEEQLLMIDQHAAHEKVKYERLMKQFREKEVLSQSLLPPVVVTLSALEQQAFEEHRQVFEGLGFGIEEFGGREFAIRQVPLELYGYGEKELFLEVLDELVEKGIFGQPDAVESRLATMACKAAVKGNNPLSEEEARMLVEELLGLENPYNCPHGRPTIVSMTKQDLERKFKRIVT